MEKIIVLATENQKKVKEFLPIFESLNKLNKNNQYVLKTLKDFNLSMQGVIENGNTFLENSLIKAKYVYELLNKKYWVIADDSGICVEILDGFPGIKSARWTVGKNDSYLAKNQKIIDMVKYKNELRNTNNWKAQFVCAITLIEDNNLVHQFKATVFGQISKTPLSNTNDAFGYDPIFLVPKLNQTFAQIPLEFKDQISHRANACKALFKYLNQK